MIEIYFSDDVVAGVSTTAANGKQRSDKSIYEKTLQMLMKAGQAAFDQNNFDDDDEQMQEERKRTEVDRAISRGVNAIQERWNTTFDRKKAHK